MDSLPHIVVFPFMSKGHTIPLIHLAHLLHIRRLAALTFITTPLNSDFLRSSLTDTPANIVILPFPASPLLPTGIESTDDLPSMTHFLNFVTAISDLRPAFESSIATLHRPVDIFICDGFLPWAITTAISLRIPTLSFLGLGIYPMVISRAVAAGRIFSGVSSKTDLVAIPRISGPRFCKADFDTPFSDPDVPTPFRDFVLSSGLAMVSSSGMIVTSFHELDGKYIDESSQPKPYLVCPLCLASPESCRTLASEVKSWLDEKLATGRPVLYVAFGTQAEVSAEQNEEIRDGLVESGVEFLWVVRTRGREGVSVEVVEGGRGMVVKGWVEQREVLRHGIVKGFVSHCGWNSMLESLCEAVPIVAWPMANEQRINARFVVEVLGAGLRVEGSDMERGAMVGKASIAKAVREALEGEAGKKVSEKAAEVAAEARRAVAEGGSSWKELERLIREVSTRGI